MMVFTVSAHRIFSTKEWRFATEGIGSSHKVKVKIRCFSVEQTPGLCTWISRSLHIVGMYSIECGLFLLYLV